MKFDVTLCNTVKANTGEKRLFISYGGLDTTTDMLPPIIWNMNLTGCLILQTAPLTGIAPVITVLIAESELVEVDVDLS